MWVLCTTLFDHFQIGQQIKIMEYSQPPHRHFYDIENIIKKEPLFIKCDNHAGLIITNRTLSMYFVPTYQ